MSAHRMAHPFYVPHDLKSPVEGAAQGPLAGLTAAVKDMYDIIGECTGAGSPEWLAAHPPAQRHAAAVARILDAGATIVGKAVCDEFFFSITGANAHYGTPVNVRAPGRLPGGSSAGSAAATAAGACDFALGSDTGGSVRIPAALCGVYGIRPSHGRVDASGAVAMAPSFDAVGWFAGGPGVLRKLGGVLLDDRRVPAAIGRLLVAEDGFANADAEVAALLHAVLARATDVLPPPERVRVAPDGLDIWRDAFRVIQGREVWQSFGAFVEAHRPQLGPGIKERIAYAETVTTAEEQAARKIHEQARAHIRALVPPGTVLTLPTAPSIAPPVDTAADDLESFRVRVMRLTCIAGLAGLPQVSLPLGTLAGCPVGLSFVGWHGGDEALLDLAVAMARHGGATG